MEKIRTMELGATENIEMNVILVLRILIGEWKLSRNKSKGNKLFIDYR